jgi:hypothetical protein
MPRIGDCRRCRLDDRTALLGRTQFIGAAPDLGDGEVGLGPVDPADARQFLTEHSFVRRPHPQRDERLAGLASDLEVAQGVIAVSGGAIKDQQGGGRTAQRVHRGVAQLATRRQRADPGAHTMIGEAKRDLVRDRAADRLRDDEEQGRLASVHERAFSNWPVLRRHPHYARAALPFRHGEKIVSERRSFNLFWRACAGAGRAGRRGRAGS